MSMKPFVSIIIPAFNRSKVIKRTLNSVLRQTYTNWECLVIDDSSTDNTKEIVSEYISNDNRFSLYSNSRKKGAQGARNEGILHSLGDWILLFDSDDILVPTYLDRVVESIVDDNTIVACYGQMIKENNGERLDLLDLVHDGNNHRSLLDGTCYLSLNATLINKKNLLYIGLLDENCPSHHELETHIRLSNYFNYRVVPDVLWYYYIDRDDSISINKEKHISGLLYIAKKHRWDYRIYAYRSFLVRMKRLWLFANNLPDKRILHFQILLITPELPLLFLRNSIKWRQK